MGAHLSLRHRLTASPQHLDAVELQFEVERLACQPVERLVRGQIATVAGRLRAVQYTPTEHVPTLVAELYDGSAPLQLVWLGRRRIPGLEPGRRLIARGRVGLRDGALAIYNPWYELQRGA